MLYLFFDTTDVTEVRLPWDSDTDLATFIILWTVKVAIIGLRP